MLKTTSQHSDASPESTPGFPPIVVSSSFAAHTAPVGPQSASSRSLHYLPTLDAWRAVAVTLVVLCHAFSNLPFWTVPGASISIHSPKWQARLMGIFNGSLGVDLFFALSGFLITYLAIQEIHDSGEFRMRRFWSRRLFRIVPLTWVYMLVFVVGSLFRSSSSPSLPTAPTAAGFLFYINYLLAAGHVPTLLAHLWTLGIEMQFYFLWALILKIARPGALPWVALSGIAAVALYRAVAAHFGIEIDGLRLASRGDSLLWGAFAGSIIASDFGLNWLRGNFRAWLSLPLLILLGFVADQHPTGFAALQPLLCAALITLTVVNAHSPVFRWMESAPLRFVGGISFSIYIWQQALTSPGSVLADAGWHSLLQPPLSLAWIIPIAWFSHRFIELPGIRIGAVLSRRSSPRAAAPGENPGTIRVAGNEQLLAEA